MFFTLNKTFPIYFAPRSSNQATIAWNKKKTLFFKAIQGQHKEEFEFKGSTT